MKQNTYKRGDNRAVCDICGFTYYASELKMTWDGLAACKYDYEPKHPQLDVKPMKENQSVSISRNPDPIFAPSLTLQYND